MAQFKLRFANQARADLAELARNPADAKRLRAVQKALGLLERNPRHPGLQTHEYSLLSGPAGGKVFEAYAENRTPAAFRIFFYYTATKGEIMIVTVTPHP